MRVFTLRDARGRSEDHGGGFDASHGHGLEVADGDDLAVLHFLERDQAVQPGADSSHGLAGCFVQRGVLRVRGVAAVNGRDVQGVGVGVVHGTQDVTNTEVDDRRRERSSRCRRRLRLLGLLLFLLLLFAPSSSGISTFSSLFGLTLSNNQRLLVLSSIRVLSSSLLLLLALLLLLRIHGLGHKPHIIQINPNLLLVGDL